MAKKKKRKYYIFHFFKTPNGQKTKGDYLWYIISLITINDIISKILLQINLSFIIIYRGSIDFFSIFEKNFFKNY